MDRDLAAKKYDPEKDPRIHGGEGACRIDCDMCEDAGNVYIARQKPSTGGWYLFRSRCTCFSPGVLPTRVWRKIPKRPDEKVTDIPSWRDSFGGRVQREELIPERLVSYFDYATGRVDLEMTEEPQFVQYRRELTKSVRRKVDGDDGEFHFEEDAQRW